VKRLGDRLLVNPGSMLPIKADQIKFKPRVYLWYADTNTVEKVFIPCPAGALTREHLERDEAKHNDRVVAFVDKLSDDDEISLDYIENLEKVISKEKVSKPVEDIIWEAVER